MSHTFDKADTGYTTGFYDGKVAERERILKLPLEHEYLENHYLEVQHFEDTCITCANIALIKGETEVNSENLKSSLKKIFKLEGEIE